MPAWLWGSAQIFAFLAHECAEFVYFMEVYLARNPVAPVDVLLTLGLRLVAATACHAACSVLLATCLYGRLIFRVECTFCIVCGVRLLVLDVYIL